MLMYLITANLLLCGAFEPCPVTQVQAASVQHEVFIGQRWGKILHRHANKRTFGPTRDFGLIRSDLLDQESRCLAIAIYYEARGEAAEGQIAVAQVILNRVKSRKYPGSICDVVYQNAHRRNRCQFSFTCDGQPDIPRHAIAWAKAKSLALAISCKTTCTRNPHEDTPLMQLQEPMRRATHYHATYASPIWRHRLKKSGQIGRHIFYISDRVWS